MKDSRSGAFVQRWSIRVLFFVVNNLFARWKELFFISVDKKIRFLCIFNISILKSPTIKVGIVVGICCNNSVSLEKNNWVSIFGYRYIDIMCTGVLICVLKVAWISSCKDYGDGIKAQCPVTYSVGPPHVDSRPLTLCIGFCTSFLKIM